MTRMNHDRLGFEDLIFEENFRTRGMRVRSENIGKSFLRFLERWGSLLHLASCVIAVLLDPLFLYIPVINHHEKCFHFDNKLLIAAFVLRSVTDITFMLHIGSQFRTGYVERPIPNPIDGVHKKVDSSWGIPETYMLSYFLIDCLSLLPLPQVAILYIPEMKGSKSLIARDILTALVLLQYVPRVVRIYPLYKKLKRTPRMFQGHPWTKVAQNFFLYVLASHVLGALWYFFSIERELTCWQKACKGHPACDHSSFFCDKGIRAAEFLDDMCPVDTPNTTLFDFGIFLDALQSGIVESENFPQKLFRCLWWGLQNISSLGQNLKTSSYVWENIFAIFMCTSGWVLFLYFIGNIQTYLQLKTEEKEKRKRSKALAVDLWMDNKKLPKPIKRMIKVFLEDKMDEIRIVDSENLIPILSTELQKTIKLHLCWNLFVRVPVFAVFDDQLMTTLCDFLKPVVYSAKSYVIRKGDRVKEMCFIFSGELLSWSPDATVKRTSCSLARLLTGDFCGEELLTWASNYGSLAHLRISNQTVQTLTEVEAFVLTADDVEFLIRRFQLQHSKKFRHILRYYSQKWRTWAAHVIQMAWRCYAKRKLKESLQEAKIITVLHLQKPGEPGFGGEDGSYRWT